MMDEKTTEKWRRMHEFTSMMFNYQREDEKRTRAECRALAHAEYLKKHGRRYRRPGISFNW